MKHLKWTVIDAGYSNRPPEAKSNPGRMERAVFEQGAGVQGLRQYAATGRRPDDYLVVELYIQYNQQRSEGYGSHRFGPFGWLVQADVRSAFSMADTYLPGSWGQPNWYPSKAKAKAAAMKLLRNVRKHYKD